MTGYPSLSGAVTPFVLEAIEVVEGTSLKEFTAAQDAMSRAGKIDVEVWDLQANASGGTVTHSAVIAPSSSDLQTTAKKSL